MKSVVLIFAFAVFASAVLASPCSDAGGSCTDVSETCNGSRKRGQCPNDPVSVTCCMPSGGASSSSSGSGAATNVVTDVVKPSGGSVSSKRLLLNTQSSGNEDPLKGNGGSGNNLIIKWNSLPSDGKIDVVVHLHGYSTDPVTEKKIIGADSIAGLDLSGRTRPTMGLLPRGLKTSDRAWTHPTLLQPGKFDQLVNYGLRVLERENNLQPNSLSKNRVIITGHSGGGGQLFKLADLIDPHEVHAFDATYYDTSLLVKWMKKHIPTDKEATKDLSGDELKEYFNTRGHVMRMVYIPNSGTARIAEETARKIKGDINDKIAPWYHVQKSRLSHNDIPKVMGPKFLADNGCCQE